MSAEGFYFCPENLKYYIKQKINVRRKLAHNVFMELRKKIEKGEPFTDLFIEYLDLMEDPAVRKRQWRNLAEILKLIYKLRGADDLCFYSRLVEARGIYPLLRWYVFYFTWPRELKKYSPCSRRVRREMLVSRLETLFMRYERYPEELIEKVLKGERSMAFFEVMLGTVLRDKKKVLDALERFKVKLPWGKTITRVVPTVEGIPKLEEMKRSVAESLS